MCDLNNLKCKVYLTHSVRMNLFHFVLADYDYSGNSLIINLTPSDYYLEMISCMIYFFLSHLKSNVCNSLLKVTNKVMFCNFILVVLCWYLLGECGMQFTLFPNIILGADVLY